MTFDKKKKVTVRLHSGKLIFRYAKLNKCILKKKGSKKYGDRGEGSL